MKKILFLAMWYLPNIGGMERATYEIVRAFVEMGFEVHVVTTIYKGYEEFDKTQDYRIVRAKGVDVSKLASDIKIKRVYNYLSLYHKYYKYVKEEIKQFKPDEIIIADEQTRNWYGFYAKRIKYSPFVVASMPERKEDWLKVRVVKRTLKAANRILCVSNSTKLEMAEVFGPEISDKLDVIYGSINDAYLKSPVNTEKVAAIKEKYSLDNKFVMLSVCRLAAGKNLKESLYALNDARKQTNVDIAYLICGEGPEYDNLNKVCHELGLTQVYFCGRITEIDDLISYYDVCDVFVLPSLSESFGLVFAEAGARHKPGLGYAVGGLREIVDDGINGYLAPLNDYETLKNDLTQYVTNKEIINRFSNNIYEKVVDNFSYDSLKKSWLKYIPIKD